MSARRAATLCAVFCLALGCRGKASNDVSPDGATLTLEVTPCYGDCPVYMLTFGSDGTVTYVGQFYVAPHGPETTRIPTAEFWRLVGQFEAIPPEKLIWDVRCIDKLRRHLPGRITTLKRNGRTQSIAHNLGDGCAPPELDPLEEAILATVKDQLAVWTRCDGQCPR